MRLAIVLGALVGLATACGGSDHSSDPGATNPDGGSSPGSGSDGGAADPGAGPAKLTLAATHAEYANRIRYSAPLSQQTYIDIALTLANTGEATPLPVTTSAFALETSEKLLYTQLPGDAARPTVCPGNVAIEDGGSLSCHVAFMFSQASTPTRVVYTDDTGRTGAAAVGSIDPAPGACTYWVPSPGISCSNCASGARQSQSSCSSQQQQVDATCASAESTGCITSDLCPQARAGCTLAPACATALQALEDCLYDSCLNLCPLIAF